jgi:hypothetical protein
MVRYAKRGSVFEKGEEAWTVEADHLVRTTPEGDQDRVAWREVALVRLRFAPTRWNGNRYQVSFTTTGGDLWSVDNIHCVGVGNFEDRSPAFTPFVLACIAHIAALAPEAEARLGTTALAYWSQLLFVGAMFALLAVVLLVLPGSLSWLILVKLALIAAMLPVMFSWIGRARPRKVALEVDVFRDALP